MLDIAPLRCGLGIILYGGPSPAISASVIANSVFNSVRHMKRFLSMLLSPFALEVVEASGEVPRLALALLFIPRLARLEDSARAGNAERPHFCANPAAA